MADYVGENVLKRIAPAAALRMQEAIAETGGREVFFAGVLDGKGRVASVRVCARGHEEAVPALFEGLGIRDVVIHNHPTGELIPSDPDLELAGMYSAHGHGMLIVDNEVTRVYVVVEPFLPDQMQWLDPAELSNVFGPGSGMARALPHYEVRPQQAQMMECVAEAFNGDGIAVVEAPTGIGKTMAYLLPAALWAVRNRERVVISTRTINLQEQIVFKDIPLLQKCLKEKFSACLVKGRGNYICRRKLARVLSEASLMEDESSQAQLDTLAEWVEKTPEGSLSDLSFVPARNLWERVCSEADTCAMNRCPHLKQCFVSKARREVAKADLVVVNNHMLFSDLAIKQETGNFSSMAVLPAYRRVIFDEAHNIEDSATEYFGVSATRLGTLATLGRFIRSERGKERGLFPFLKVRLIKDCPLLPLTEFEAIQQLIEEQVLPGLAASREALMGAFTALRLLAAEQCGQIGRDIKWRLTEAVLGDPAVRRVHLESVIPAVNEVQALVKHCVALVKRLQAVPVHPDDRGSPIEMETMQVQAYTKRLERIAGALAECMSETLEANTVRWIEIDAEKEQYVRIARCPLHVGQSLADGLYANLKTVAMTSATLTVRHEFTYLFSRLGLDRVDASRVRTLALSSPFDFSKQAMLCMATDLPSPDERSFLAESVACMRQVLQVTGGHAFVLFTSFSALDYAYRTLEGELRAAGCTPLRQGQAARTQLLDQFRDDSASVLFATVSFWEGVDVAGESLQCVILTRLPLRVHTEPILQARAEAIEQAGGNAFLEYSVPQAVIKFRQGFGRLIRRKTDRGVVVVLDRRVVTKFYGRVFIESLPDIHTVRGSRQTVLAALAEFFGQTLEPPAETHKPSRTRGVGRKSIKSSKGESEYAD